MKTKKKGQEDLDLSGVIGGNLNIFGLRLDLGKLLSSPEDVKGQLEGLRERLKELGGREVLSDEDWRQGRANVSGHVRVRSLGGDEEYHIGTSGRRRPPTRPEKAPEPPEVVEPSLDLFDEPQGVVVVADVPGVELEDLDIRMEDNLLSISTRPAARRAYRKDLPLEADVDTGSLEASCRNGVLEIRLRKKVQEG